MNANGANDKARKGRGRICKYTRPLTNILQWLNISV